MDLVEEFNVARGKQKKSLRRFLWILESNGHHNPFDQSRSSVWLGELMELEWLQLCKCCNGPQSGVCGKKYLLI